MKCFSLIVLTIFITFQIHAQEDKKWDVSNPPGSYRETSITTTEGTWMNLDVSPDGQEVVFDLLGDIYLLPISGGDAKILREGLAYEVQPRFSPDGSKISFTSDAGGGDNIWIMDKNGSNAKQVTKEKFRLLNNAVWTPDGQYLIARKHFTSTRSLGAGELWMYHLSGGIGLQLTKRKNDQQDLGEPSVSPDGRYVYYSEDMYPGGSFQYNKNPNSQIYVIKRLEFDKDKTITITGGPGGAMRPQISRSGKLMAFVKRVREKTVLYIHDLATGEEWPIFDQLNKDQQEAWAIFGVYTNSNWTPDDQNIVIWAKGEIWKINVNTLDKQVIPFKVTANHKLAETVKFKNEVFTENFTAKAIKNAITSPDGNMLVFNAIGYLWKRALPNGKPTRITNGSDLEFEPSFSKDGSEIVYVTWNDENLGAIYKFNFSERRASPIKVTSEKGIYRTPSYSPNGDNIVYVKSGGNTNQGFTFNKEPGIYVMSSSGRNAKKITDTGSFPVYSQDGTRIFFQTGGYFFGDLTKFYKSVKIDGSDEKIHLKSKYANKFSISPDNKWVAYSQLFKVYVTPFISIGKEIDLDSKSKAMPVTQIARDAGYNIHWSSNSKNVMWTLGEEYFSVPLKDRFTFLEGSPDSLPPLDTVGIKIDLEVKTDKPEGEVVFQGGTIITMNGDEVIEDGVVVVEGNKIKAIGEIGKISWSGNAKVIDTNGKTLMPGLVDVHAHLGQFRFGISPQKHWQYYANLAYGITTTHDPSVNTETAFSQAEMVKAGNMVGPRLYSTGIILYGADGDFKAVIDSLDDARSAIRRTKAFGAFSVKSYNQPRREQRQQVIQAARENNIMVYPEGGSSFFHNLSMIIDGHTGIEHNIPIAPVYSDVIQLWAAAGSGYTPTLIVNYGGLTGEHYWYQTTNVWENEKLLKYTPRSIIDARSRHRTMVPLSEYDNGHILTSKVCKALTDAGVKVNLGAHGQLQGLGVHWELWMLSQGGMSNMEALRSATINGAQYIGMGDEIGTLETGKLADIIVLDKNPLDDIKNSESVKYTMVNGRLYDTETMNEIGNYDKARTKFYWENNKYNRSFDWHEANSTIGEPKCVCGY